MHEGVTRMVAIPLDGPVLVGEVTIPRDAVGVAVFADGTGTATADGTYRPLAARLADRGHGTVLVDLLTEQEGRTLANRFDVDRLTDRLHAVIRWVTDRPDAGGLPLCLVGTNTGAAAAVRVATTGSVPVGSLAVLAGRIDLASDAANGLPVPTLVVLGSEDRRTAELARTAIDDIGRETSLVTVEGAGHTFADPDHQALAGDRIADWFDRSASRRGAA